jgi:hypothetical protein
MAAEAWEVAQFKRHFRDRVALMWGLPGKGLLTQVSKWHDSLDGGLFSQLRTELRLGARSLSSAFNAGREREPMWVLLVVMQS